MKEYFSYPKKCPSCKSTTRIDGKYLICENEDCEGAAIGAVMKWITKTGIQKLGVGRKTIENLFESNLIKSPVDLYKLNKKDILSIERQGDKSAEKLLAAIDSKRELDLVTFIGALNIKDFSSSMCEKLIEAGYNKLDKLLVLASSKDVSEITSIDGFGEKKAISFIEGLNKKVKIINELLSVLSVRDAVKEKKNMTGKLCGQSFCFTGSINRIDDETGKHMVREKLQSLVKENGGEVYDSVKKGLTFLVMADVNSISGKAQKAKKLGIALCSEDNFFKMIGK